MTETTERIDDTGFGGLKVIQSSMMFSYAVDAVLLAAFTAGETGAKIPAGGFNSIVDLGCGTGIIPFLLSHKTEAAEIIGIEKEEISYNMAVRGVRINNLENKVRIIKSDVLNFDTAIIGKVDAVTTNPPYFRKESGIPNRIDAKFTARHETTAALADFIKSAAEFLPDGGHFFMVHRPSRLVDIFTEMRFQHLEPKEIQFVIPREGGSPNIVLIHAVKGAGKELKILETIPVHGEGNSYTPMICKLYERVNVVE